MTRVERSASSELPQRFIPMDMIKRDIPFDREGWFFEPKMDGYRGVAGISNGRVDLYSKTKASFKGQFPAIEASLAQIEHQVVLDGEIVILDENGKPDFELISKYRGKGPKKGTERYYVFDILFLDGRNLMSRPLSERKKLLKEILPKEHPHVRFLDYFESKGAALFKAIQEKELEGMVAKDPNSIYIPGIKSRSWIKIKNYVRRGWTEKRFRPQ